MEQKILVTDWRQSILNQLGKDSCVDAVVENCLVRIICGGIDVTGYKRRFGIGSPGAMMALNRLGARL